jgi:hypothetical protein
MKRSRKKWKKCAPCTEVVEINGEIKHIQNN